MTTLDPQPRNQNWRLGGPLGFADRILGWVVNFTTLLACLAVVALVAAVSREIVGRYMFGSPSSWVDEFSGYVAAGITFLGAAYALRNGELVAVTLLTDRMGEKARHWLMAIGMTASVAILTVVVFQVATYVGESYADSIRSNSGLQIPLWIPRAIMMLGLGVLLLETVRQTILLYITALNRQATDASTSLSSSTHADHSMHHRIQEKDS